MEGAQFIPPHRINLRLDQICAECRRTFRPRLLGDGAEEICDECYTAQFEPRRLRHWQKSQGRLHPHPPR